MKKNLFFISVAVLALSSCNNDTVVDENLSANQPKEIAIQAIATPTTRAAVDGTGFPTDISMKVTAYDVTASAVYFDATTFSYADSKWTGARYWPFTGATINFLAIANANADNASGVTWGDNKVNSVTIVMADNSEAQRDLMYACGTGTVSQSGNDLTYPGNVPMTFKHAQAWVKFTVQAGDATSAEKITVNSITLNSVSCQGTYVVTHANYTATDGSNSVSGVWTVGTTGNIPAVKTLSSDLSTSVQNFGSLMVIPNQGMASFTINYTLDGKTYNYTYTPASTSLAQATKYTYNIKLTVHEIVIAPTVDDWTDGGSTAVNI